ncbi:hypothetical protein KKF84_16810, partial [Myxococcota bacterium]|nr:hypothetical protein [Myxococcota bacterium]
MAAPFYLLWREIGNRQELFYTRATTGVIPYGVPTSPQAWYNAPMNTFLFDLDGTVTDTKADIVFSIGRTLEL